MIQIEKKVFVLIFLIILCFCGCEKTDYDSDGEETKTLTLAVFESNLQLSEQVVQFNENNKDYKIEVKEYVRSTVPEEDGRAKLQREIMSGEGPDIIDFGSFYTVSDIVGQYTENLMPYLEAEMQKNQVDYFKNVLEAFYYKDGLYAIPVSFGLRTFAGNEEILGERDHWNIDDMIEGYSKQNDEMILYPGETKKDVFATILTGSVDYYIDWENGNCSFDGDEFKKVVSFADSFPDKIEFNEEDSLKQLYVDKKALLLPLNLTNIYDICNAEYVFGDKVTYIGFPVEGDSGTVIIPNGSMLAISISSKNKEAAWEFIYQFLEEEYQKEISNGFPVCKTALEKRLEENSEIEYVVDEQGLSVPKAKGKIQFVGEETVELYNLSEKQADSLLELISNAKICTAIDYQLYNALLEEAYSFFSGDKTLEQATDIMQSRASIYVSERVK